MLVIKIALLVGQNGRLRLPVKAVSTHHILLNKNQPTRNLSR